MTRFGFVPDNSNLKKTSGTPNLYFDSKSNVFFKRDEEAYEVTSPQLPAIVGGAFVNLMREPHSHQLASL